MGGDTVIDEPLRIKAAILCIMTEPRDGAAENDDCQQNSIGACTPPVQCQMGVCMHAVQPINPFVAKQRPLMQAAQQRDTCLACCFVRKGHQAAGHHV